MSKAESRKLRAQEAAAQDAGTLARAHQMACQCFSDEKVRRTI